MIIIPAVVINNTTPQVSITLADPGQPTYAAFKQSLGNYVYKIDKLYLYSDNFKQITGIVKYNRYDAAGDEKVANITPTADPYQGTNGLYVPLDKYETSIILNGNSSLSTTILANTKLLVRFYCRRVNNSFGLHKYNFDEIERIFRGDFYKPEYGYELSKADIIFNNLPPEIQERLLLRKGLRASEIKKLPYNGVTEAESKEPAIILSFASLMIAYYILSKQD